MIASSIWLPTWLIAERYLTLATWGLVVATLLLVIDSWRKGTEQRRRWKREDEQHNKDREEERARWRREDEIRLDAQLPKPIFGVDLRSISSHDRDPVTIWCANLGSVAFHIETVFVRRMTDLGDGQHDAHFEPQTLVNSGEMARLNIPSTIFRGLLFQVDMEFRISVATASTHLKTDAKVYSVFCAEQGQVSKVENGFREDRTVLCVKCGSTGFLSPNGVASKAGLIEIMDRAAEELLESCPNHSSTVLRSILNTDGIRTWSHDQREGG